MGLLDLFKSTPRTNNGFEHQELGVSRENGQPEIPEKIFVQREPEIDYKPVERVTQDSLEKNIDLLYAYLDRDMEKRGYDDALLNPDISHLNQNIEALKNELHRIIRKVKTYYEDFIREVDFHIESRSRSGMIDTVDELRMKRATAESHIMKIVEIETEAKNNIGDSQGIIISYTRGFKNGLSAISHHSILKKKL